MSKPHARPKRLLRSVLPFAISGALLAYLFTRVDARAMAESLTPGVLLRWALPLVAFNFVTLAIESHCLHRVVRLARRSLDHWTTARIKAACYLLSVINYAVGAAGLSILLRRRAQLPLMEAASVVFLISLFDVGAVLVLAALGATLLQTDALGVRIGLMALMIGAIAAGFVFLRIPVSLGPLDRVRDMFVFRASRLAPAPLLVELGVLRLVFIGCYVVLLGALLAAFGIDVGALRLAMNTAILLVVAALPIAAGGLGTGQLAFVELFEGSAAEAELLAASLVYTLGLISSRALLGWAFAFEFTREALEADRIEEST